MKHYIIAIWITIVFCAIGMFIGYTTGRYGKLIVDSQLDYCRHDIIKLKEECICTN